jgi:hypothetical protein
MGYGFHLLFLLLAWLAIALIAHAVVDRYFTAASRATTTALSPSTRQRRSKSSSRMP